MYDRAPINKQAARVTSQTGCEDEFHLTAKEELRVLGLRKKDLSDQICKIKADLGIEGSSRGRKTPYPKHILNNPKFKKYKVLKDRAAALDEKIKALRDSVPKFDQHRFEQYFISTVRTEYPEVYEDVKAKVKKELE